MDTTSSMLYHSVFGIHESQWTPGEVQSGMERGRKQTTVGGAGKEVRVFQRKAISTQTR